MVKSISLKLDWILAFFSIAVGIYLQDNLWIFFGIFGLILAKINPAEKLKILIQKKFKKNSKQFNASIEKETLIPEVSQSSNKKHIEYTNPVVVLAKNKHNLLDDGKFRPKSSFGKKWG